MTKLIVGFCHLADEPKNYNVGKYINSNVSIFRAMTRIEVTRRRGRRPKQLLDDLGDRKGYSHLKEEALDRTKWRNRFGRGCGPVVCLITDDDDRLWTCRLTDY
jgi:hypothetical protein